MTITSVLCNDVDVLGMLCMFVYLHYNLTYQYLFPFVDHVISHLMDVITVPFVRFTIGCELVQRVNLLPWMASNIINVK